MPVRQLNSALTQKQSFVAITVFGVLALLLGLALIIFAHYHERAYVFLGLGAAAFIGGIAGIVGAGPKVKTAFSYGGIALGIMGIIVGINYLTNTYGPPSSPVRGGLVVALSIVIVLVGIVSALIVQPTGGIEAFSSVIMLGVIASIGVGALLAGTVYLVVLQYHGHAYLLLGVGAVCLLAGIAWSIFAQSKSLS
jgi:hypothetical protein